MSIDLSGSVRAGVLAHLVETFKTIRTGTPDSYRFDLKPTSVVAEGLNILGVPDTELPFITVEPSTKGQHDYRPAFQLEVSFVVLVTMRAQANGTDPARKIATGEAMLRDIERAVTRDITRGGLVVDTRVIAPAAPLCGLGQDNNVIVLVELDVRFHRTFGEP